MKKHIVNLIVIVTCLSCGFLIYVASYSKNVGANKSTTSIEALELHFRSYIEEVKSYGEIELWGYEASDDLDNLTFGDPISVYEWTEDYYLKPTGSHLYPIYAGEYLRSGIEMRGDEFVGTIGIGGYIGDYISLYEKYKEANPNIGDYNVVYFGNAYLLMFKENNKMYLLGDILAFDWPSGKGNPCKLEEFAKVLKVYTEEVQAMWDELE